jgi:hypothetical protein
MTALPSPARLLCAAGIAFSAGPAFAADPPRPVAPAPVASAPVESDALLALKTKAVIASDRQLVGLNLLVSVVDRAAVVGGPVPDAALAKRVDEVVRRVPGLISVTVSCWVPTPEDPFAKLVGDKVAAPPAAPVVTVPSLAVNLPPDRPVPPATVTAKGPDGAPGTVTVQKVASPGSARFLMDPVGSGGVPVRSTSQPSAAPDAMIPPPAVPTAPDPTLAERIAEVRGRDARFTGFTVSLKGGTAVVSGTAAKPDDAWAYAAALGTVPGIERVVVGAVKERP